MVTRWGMSDALGPLQYAEADEEVFLGYSMNKQRQMSNETAQLIDAEIKSIVEGGYVRAKEVLTENIDQLHALAKPLLEYDTSEEHTSELTSLMLSSYAFYRLKTININPHHTH